MLHEHRSRGWVSRQHQPETKDEGCSFQFSDAEAPSRGKTKATDEHAFPGFLRGMIGLEPSRGDLDPFTLTHHLGRQPFGLALRATDQGPKLAGDNQEITEHG